MLSRFLHRKIKSELAPDYDRLYDVPPEISPWRSDLTIKVTRVRAESEGDLFHFTIQHGEYPDIVQIDHVRQRTKYHVKVPSYYSSQFAPPVTSGHASKYTLGQMVQEAVLSKGQRFFIVKNNIPRALVAPVSRQSLDLAISSSAGQCHSVSMGGFQKQFKSYMDEVELGKTFLLSSGKSIVAIVQPIDSLPVRR